jgi:hypothetical protein
MKRNAAKDKELADNAYLLRAWKRWHRDQLEEALAGPHGAAVAQVMKFLGNMQPQSAPALIALLREHDWQQIDADVRFVVLHEINTAITKFRERSGLLPIDDALPPHANTVFLIIRELLGAQGNARRSGSGSTP